MANNKQNKNNPKYLGNFWPIFIIIIVSMIAGGVIYAFAYANMQQDEIDSISFWHPFATHNRTASTTAVTKVKTPVKK
jgi:hypothetical protein